MNKIENKPNQFTRIIKIILWSITILSFMFFIYKVVLFATSASYYDFELDEEVKPTASMVLVYSVGAIIGASIIPATLWLIYGFFLLIKGDRLKKIKADLKSKRIDSNADTIPSNDGLKSILPNKLSEISKNISPRAKLLFGFIWVLFHLFMLLTSKDVFDYRFTWEDFWFFDAWQDYQYRYYKSHYDISEFTIYVIVPLLIVFGGKYLKGEKFLNSEQSYSIKKSNTDDRINDLKKYKELFDLGVITEEEFTEIKKNLLG